MVRSAVSSVSTPGVLVTMMPRALAVATSMWSTPGPEVGDQLRAVRRPRDQQAASMLVGDGGHQHVGAASWPRPVHRPSWVRRSTFSSVSNSSRIRVSTGSGSLRVTMTFGLRAAHDAVRKAFPRWRVTQAGVSNSVAKGPMRPSTTMPTDLRTAMRKPAFALAVDSALAPCSPRARPGSGRDRPVGPCRCRATCR